MCLAQGPQRSDAGEARTRGPSVSSQALYHWTTALPTRAVTELLYTHAIYTIVSWAGPLCLSFCMQGNYTCFFQRVYQFRTKVGRSSVCPSVCASVRLCGCASMRMCVRHVSCKCIFSLTVRRSNFKLCS